MDDAIRYMNQAWRKVIAREALEREQRKRQHVLGCPVCFDLLDSDSCEALERASLKMGKRNQRTTNETR